MTDLKPRPWEIPYNGFSWKQRCAVTPIQNAALKSGRLVRPTICSICGDARTEYPQGRDYRFLHTEDYDQPLVIYPACKPCHAALHSRFRDPERWQRLLGAHGRPGDWFHLLSLEPASQFQPFTTTYRNGLPPTPIALARQSTLKL